MTDSEKGKNSSNDVSRLFKVALPIVLVVSVIMGVMLHVFVLEVCPQKIEQDNETGNIGIYHSLEFFTCTPHQEATKAVIKEYNRYATSGYDIGPEDAYIMYKRQVEGKTDSYPDPVSDVALTPNTSGLNMG